jgi:LacI family transcriptional regulator
MPSQPGKSVTIYDVARECGVSISTVSRALNSAEIVKPATRQKVLDAAARLGYVANAQARSLAGGRANVVGLLVPGLINGYIAEIARGIDEELARADYNLMVYTTRRHRSQESAYVDSIVNGFSAGLLLIVPLVPVQYLAILAEKNFPYVMIDQADNSGMSTVVDATNWQGMYDATSYLIGLGHTRIGFITGLMDIRSAVDRLDGYKTALSDHQIPLDDSLIARGDFWPEEGYKAANVLLEHPDRPTAIIASNDLMALSAMDAIREHNLTIPDDISILGFDDIPQGRIMFPRLTTVRQPLEQMGRIAVKLLLERIEAPDLPPKHITLATELIQRDSCQSPAPRR